VHGNAAGRALEEGRDGAHIMVLGGVILRRAHLRVEIHAGRNRQLGRRDVQPVRCGGRKHDGAKSPVRVCGVEEGWNAADQPIADGVILNEPKSQADIHGVPPRPAGKHKIAMALKSCSPGR
jgi:hypothetical protein